MHPLLRPPLAQDVCQHAVDVRVRAPEHREVVRRPARAQRMSLQLAGILAHALRHRRQHLRPWRQRGRAACGAGMSGAQVQASGLVDAHTAQAARRNTAGLQSACNPLREKTAGVSPAARCALPAASASSSRWPRARTARPGRLSRKLSQMSACQGHSLELESCKSCALPELCDPHPRYRPVARGSPTARMTRPRTAGVPSMYPGLQPPFQH